jgi:hypothetical protein
MPYGYIVHNSTNMDSYGLLEKAHFLIEIHKVLICRLSDTVKGKVRVYPVAVIRSIKAVSHGIIGSFMDGFVGLERSVLIYV